jgi:hypothetical protein
MIKTVDQILEECEDVSSEFLLNELSIRAEYWFKQVDGSYDIPADGRVAQLLQMAIAARIKP